MVDDVALVGAAENTKGAKVEVLTTVDEDDEELSVDDEVVVPDAAELEDADALE